MSIDERAGQRRVGQPGREFTLLDRRTERAAIDRVLDAVRDGLSGTLILRGGPGVGKTTIEMTATSQNAISSQRQRLVNAKTLCAFSWDVATGTGAGISIAVMLLQTIRADARRAR